MIHFFVISSTYLLSQFSTCCLVSACTYLNCIHQIFVPIFHPQHPFTGSGLHQLLGLSFHPSKWPSPNTVNSEIFARILFFANSVKRHICDITNSRLGHYLPISTNNRVILEFCEGFISTKLRSFTKIKLSGKFLNLQ